MKEDPVTPADIIVLLQGGFPRSTLEAADLYQQEVAPQIFLATERLPDGFLELLKRNVEVKNITEVQADILEQLGVPSDALVVEETVVESTREEAQLFAQYHQKHPEISHVLLIARRPQARRAGSTFRKFLPDEVRVSVHTSRFDEIRPDNWWKDTWYLREVSEEFLKHGYNLLSRISPLPER